MLRNIDHKFTARENELRLHIINFFCSLAEFDQYVTEMELDSKGIIKADMALAMEEAKGTFEV